MNMKIQLPLVLTLAVLAITGQAADSPAFNDPKEKSSYALGASIGGNFKRQEVDVNMEFFVKGLKDATAGNPVLTEQEIRDVLATLQKDVQAKQMEKRKQLGEKNKADGQKFLAENKTKDGVITLPSGLQYKVLTPGQGESPRSNDVATVNYRGTLIDGTEFDSSYKRNAPATFAVNGVVKGWTEALQLMKPGAKWQLFLPPELAYGERGSGQQIGPNAALVFEVELISATPPPAPAGAPQGQPVVTSDIIKVPSKQELEKGAKIEVIKAEDVEKLQQQQKQSEKK